MNAPRFFAAAAFLLAPMIGAMAAAPESPAGASSCSGCHPANTGIDTPIPRLNGRNAAEISEQMKTFRAGQRSATVMGRIAKGFSDDEIEAIAAWYAEQR
ncbi:MAG: c-type cytochrome [Bradyrhizobium sp.]|uniref:c-type cytochrome n=1 Tax=Bradyrhizobium sp. TaxID=376 RepID=UPI002726171D|nr:c-type cytochrome [Bradyrhizobium sp.]MDO8397960.1 c-type cytochrome [Bradyrhizobium sp.]